MSLPGDNPIKRPEDDVLGRARVAESFARQILLLDSSEGIVVGVLGAWGSGKTSFVNLVRVELEHADVAILDFNPWMFSGAEQLVESFFVELAAQLKIRPGFAAVGRDLEDYGETFSGMAWLPLVGPWIERGRGATKILSRILQRRKEGVSGRRAKLADALAALEKPILVVLDDIDRLSTSEIRDVFKLVRLTASFPNVVYIVAFDRARVEEALAEQGVPGRAYLEKILQVAIDLPAVPRSVLDSQVLGAVNDALADIDNPGPFDDQTWPDVFAEIIRPLIRNMRDVRRYAVSIRGSVESFDGGIALVDVLALEAIRVFLPDVFSGLQGAVDALTSTSTLAYGPHGDQAKLKAQIDRLLVAAESNEEVVRALVERLFPAGQRHLGGSHYGSDWKGRWLIGRRVAHEDILRLYLERVAGESLEAFAYAEQTWTVMSDRDALDTYLRSIDTERTQDVIASLEAYADQFTYEHVVPATIVLLNLLGDLPERERGMLTMDTRMVVTRVVLRLLRAAGDLSAVEEAVREILPELHSVSAQAVLISIIGYRDGRGHELVSEAAAAEFEKEWRERVRSAGVEELIQGGDLIRVFLIAKREAGSSEPTLVMDSAPALTLAVLAAARSDVRSQSAGSRTVRRSPRLAWDVLVDLYGDEATLRERIDALKATNPEGNDDLFDLTDKYLGGWRPNDFGDS